MTDTKEKTQNLSVSIQSEDAIFLGYFPVETISSQTTYDERRRREKDLTIAREQLKQQSKEQKSVTNTPLLSINTLAAVGLLLIILFDFLVYISGSSHIYVSRISQILSLTSSNSITAYIAGIVNILTTSIFFAITIYTNATSLEMVKHSKGVKQHKKLAKICYISGLASTASFLVCGFTGNPAATSTEQRSSEQVHLISIAIVQIYTLFMSIGTAKMKQLVSHRIWSYCISAFQLKIALKLHLRLLFEFVVISEKQSYTVTAALIDFCTNDLSTILAIAYLLYQEYQLNLIHPVTTPTFQISQSSYFASSTDSEIPLGIRLHVAKKLVQIVLLLHFGISGILRIFADEKAYILFATIENIIGFVYVISVLAPMMIKVKREKKLRKQRMIREKQQNEGITHSKST